MKKKTNVLKDNLILEQAAGNCLMGDHCFEAVSVLAKGGVVAFPTETYYGLAVDPNNEKALEKLFFIKKRERSKAILLLIYDQAQLSVLTGQIPLPYEPLIEKYWPGALTLIFDALEGISPLITGGTGGVGVRVTSHPIALNLCKAWKAPITATSANISGQSPAESAEEVEHIFGSDVDYIIDGGQSPAGECSTIVGLEKGLIRVIRKGKITLESFLSKYQGIS